MIFSFYETLMKSCSLTHTDHIREERANRFLQNTVNTLEKPAKSETMLTLTTNNIDKIAAVDSTTH